MIKSNDLGFVHDFSGAPWEFDWHGEVITKDTFYPYNEADDGRYWFFKGNENKAAVVNNFVDQNLGPQHDIWNPDEPWFEYDAENIQEWDSEHHLNPTRYLAPNNSYIKLTNTIETVIIDSVPPKFISDTGTEYLLINAKENSIRKCKFTLQDEAGLDYKQFAIFLGKDESGTPPSREDIAAMYQEEELPDWWIYCNYRKYSTKINNSIIDENSLHIRSNGKNLYQVEFNLKYVKGYTDAETLKRGLYIYVWDKAANESRYVFGREGSPSENRFIDIESAEEIADLQPLQIEFFDLNPENMVLPPNTSGSVWCKIFNPNSDFRVFNITEQLDSFSVGNIDKTTYDDSKYSSEGIIIFKITDIVQHGQVTVEAWLESGISSIDDVLKAATYAQATIGPWIAQDPNGRLYDIKRYVPTYMRNTDFNEFIKFFELYLNTVFTDLSNASNISILEKIARIGDFNDIDKIEADMIKHYAKCFSAEYGLDLDDIANLNKSIFNKNTLSNVTSDEDVNDILRFALKNLPHYNQVKGTEKGMLMAMKMFSLTCRVINLWCKTSPVVEKNPELLSEDELETFANYYMTSRFDVSFADGIEKHIDFTTFIKNAKTLVKLITNVKPITKILNYIKYIITSKHDLHAIQTVSSIDGHPLNGTTFNTVLIPQNINIMPLKHNDNMLPYRNDTATYAFNKIKANISQRKVTAFWLPFWCNYCYTYKVDSSQIEFTGIYNNYTTFAKMLSIHKGKFYLGLQNFVTVTYKHNNVDGTFAASISVEIDLADIDVEILDTGVYLKPTSSRLASDLYAIYEAAFFPQNSLFIENALKKQHLGEEITDIQYVSNAQLNYRFDLRYVHGSDNYSSIKYETGN